MLIDRTYFNGSEILPSADQKDDVPTGEFKIGSQELATCGASMCIVLAAHNEDSKQGLIGHFTAIEPNSDSTYYDGEEFNKAIDSIPALEGDQTKTHVWIGGGSPELKNDGVDAVLVDKQYAIQRARELVQISGIVPAHITVDWSGEDRVIDVSLSCPEGVLKINDFSEHTPGQVSDAMLAALLSGHEGRKF